MAATETADVVVIGGGILGCSAAYHLHQAGVERVVLVEQAPALAMETTAAGAGFVSLWGAEFAHWGDLELSLERYGHQFYRELGATHDIGLKTVGMARVAVAPAGARLLAAHYEHARTLVTGDEVRLLTADQMSDIVPTLASGQVCAALFWPAALRVDAPRATQALGRELERAGVQIRTNTEVTAIMVNQGHVTGVETSAGPLFASAVVSAAGAWTQRIASMVGASVPVTPLLTWRFVTEPIPAVPATLPLLFFSTYADPYVPHVYVREHNGGLLIGAYPHASGSTLSHLRDVSHGATPRTLTIPTDLRRYADDAVRNLAVAWPPLAQARVTERSIGLPVYTPDGRHLLGVLANVEGLYLIGGDNEAGISHGPGLGKLVAELVTSGVTSVDTTPYRLDRFTAQDEAAAATVLMLKGHDAR